MNELNIEIIIFSLIAGVTTYLYIRGDNLNLVEVESYDVFKDDGFCKQTGITYMSLSGIEIDIVNLTMTCINNNFNQYCNISNKSVIGNFTINRIPSVIVSSKVTSNITIDQFIDPLNNATTISINVDSNDPLEESRWYAIRDIFKEEFKTKLPDGFIEGSAKTSIYFTKSLNLQSNITNLTLITISSGIYNETSAKVIYDDDIKSECLVIKEEDNVSAWNRNAVLPSLIGVMISLFLRKVCVSAKKE
jgi:hypothetical protein